jgi:hypothetical protein
MSLSTKYFNQRQLLHFPSFSLASSSLRSARKMRFESALEDCPDKYYISLVNFCSLNSLQITSKTIPNIVSMAFADQSGIERAILGR